MHGICCWEQWSGLRSEVVCGHILSVCSWLVWGCTWGWKAQCCIRFDFYESQTCRPSPAPKGFAPSTRRIPNIWPICDPPYPDVWVQTNRVFPDPFQEAHCWMCSGSCVAAGAQVWKRRFHSWSLLWGTGPYQWFVPLAHNGIVWWEGSQPQNEPGVAPATSNKGIQAGVTSHLSERWPLLASPAYLAVDTGFYV